MGETGAASSLGPEVLLKSGLKLSLLTMGGKDGGAAIVGVVVVDDEAAVIGGHDQPVGCRTRRFSSATLASLGLPSFNVMP